LWRAPAERENARTRRVERLVGRVENELKMYLLFPSFLLPLLSFTHSQAIVWQRQKICDNDDEGERIECWELNATAAAGSNAA
jgi:hypothetical protein